MLRAITVIRKNRMNSIFCADNITLDAEGRYRRRVAIKGDSGALYLLDLPQAVFLHDGDGLLLEDGRHLAVKAAPEMLYEIRAQDSHSLLRLAWHLGNRHTPTELKEHALYISADHVLADMLRGLGADVRDVVRPFNPEGGAYGDHGAAHGAGHSHGGHVHSHDQG